MPSTDCVTVTYNGRPRRLGARGSVWIERPNSGKFKANVVLVAIPPRLTGLEAPDERMVGVCEVVGAGVVVDRLIATTDGPAASTDAQVHPFGANAKAFLTPVALWRLNFKGIGGDMGAVGRHRARIPLRAENRLRP